MDIVGYNVCSKASFEMHSILRPLEFDVWKLSNQTIWHDYYYYELPGKQLINESSITQDEVYRNAEFTDIGRINNIDQKIASSF